MKSECQSINPYDLLGVTSKSTIDEVKNIYISMALFMHPDKGGSTSDMHILNMAYKWIREQLLIVENKEYKDYDSIQLAFDNFIKNQDEAKLPPLTHLHGESIGYDYSSFCKLYDKIIATQSNKLQGYNKNFIYSFIYSSIHLNYINQSILQISKEQLWEYVETQLISHLSTTYDTDNTAERRIPSSIPHGYGSQMESSATPSDEYVNMTPAEYTRLQNDTSYVFSEQLIQYIEPTSINKYNNIGIPAEKLPEKLSNYSLNTPLLMADYLEAYCTSSNIRLDLEKQLNRMNITAPIEELMKKRLIERESEINNL